MLANQLIILNKSWNLLSSIFRNMLKWVKNIKAVQNPYCAESLTFAASHIREVTQGNLMSVWPLKEIHEPHFSTIMCFFCFNATTYLPFFMFVYNPHGTCSFCFWDLYQIRRLSATHSSYHHRTQHNFWIKDKKYLEFLFPVNKHNCCKNCCVCFCRNYCQHLVTHRRPTLEAMNHIGWRDQW